MNFSKRQTLILVAGLAVLIVGGYFFLASLRSRTQVPQIELTVWGTDPSSAFDGVIEAYRAVRSNVKIAYHSFGEADYEDQLLNAQASGRGPDLLMLGARALPKQIDRLVPADPAQIDLTRMRERFPTVAEQDFTQGASVYAVPLYIDSLALLYNRDLFDAAGIVKPPATWAEFQDDVVRLRAINATGQITKAGAAIGGSSKSVTRAPQIIYALMLQNSVDMTDGARTTATFASDLGLEAFNFYLRFADTASSAYTWNDNLPVDIESFAAGKTAMIIGYRSDLDAVKKKSPFLRAAAAPLPQLASDSSPVTYADYRGLAVSRQSTSTAWAWDFATFAATDETAAKAYTKATGRTPALRSLLSSAFSDPDEGVFARQALVARSWYEYDQAKIDAVFDGAIRAVLAGQLDSSRALRQAKETVDAIIMRK